MRRWIMLAGAMMAGVLVGMLTGCSGFDRRWEHAAASPPPADDITGRWIGAWRSNHNDDTGQLRAIVSRNDDGSYHVDYHATYGTLLTLTFSYALDMQPTQDEGGVWRFAGESDLGVFGGYRHDGYATPAEFAADYEASAGDHGTYRMTRPE